VTIPTTKTSVQLDQLHPKFVVRLEAFFTDRRIQGKVAVSSGCRTYAQQMYFFKKYLKGGNLAANPDRRFGAKGLDGQGIWRGSWHMEQLDGWCYAVDLQQLDKKLPKPEINKIATSYGVVPTIQDREWWHHQPRRGVDWFEAPALTGEPTEKPDAPEPVMDWLGIAKMLHAQRGEVSSTPLRRGSRGGAVKTAQKRLGAIGFDAGVPDGIFGRKTTSAVKRYQKGANVHPVDGVIGLKTWDAMWQPAGDISGLYK